MAKHIYVFYIISFIFVTMVSSASHSMQWEKTVGIAWEQASEMGPLNFTSFTIEAEARKASTASSPLPKALFVVLPTNEGHYPILIFLHGYLAYNILNHTSFYSNILKHVASHGYIVVAPQIDVWKPDATEDVHYAAEITDWLRDGLHSYLVEKDLENVDPDFSKVAIAGHSRGGKVAFALALARVQGTATSLNFSALIGLDPVDGMGLSSPLCLLYKPCVRCGQTKPCVLTTPPGSFNLSIPVLVVGSGIGGSCIPTGLNHISFFEKCRVHAYHFVASNYGHMDFLDEKHLVSRACGSGGETEPMQKFAGGIVVAFLNASLSANSTALDDIFHHPSLALPVELDRPEYKVAEPSEFDKQFSEI